jgi:uncharacterized cupredoxin-like copper-binding protein
VLKKLALGIAAATTILSLAACSSATSAGTAIAVVTTDYKFAPTSWTVSKGQSVSLTLQNTGALDHEWVLLKKDTAVTLPFDDDDEDKVYWEIEANPGQTQTGTFTAPAEAGTYTVVCGTPAHLEQGMEAELVVQ